MRAGLRATRFGAGAVALIFALAAGARAEQPTVVRLTLDGVVDPFIASYVVSGIEAAEAQGAQAVLLTIDTPGGLDSSMRKIIQAIVNSKVPVICYVSPEGARAASAGTFIMMGCPVAAMAPATEIGAAHPVGVSGAIEQQKVTNDAVAYIQSLARRNGRNEQWAKDAVVKSVSIPADEALQMDVIDLIAPTTQTLLQDVDGKTVRVGGGQTVTLKTAGATIESRNLGVGISILHALFTPDFAFIFFYLGIGFLIYWILHPVVFPAGFVGMGSLLLFFVTLGLLPFQIIGVVLLLASAGFLLLELKHPGLGVATVGGVITLVLGGLLLFNPNVPSARVSPWVILPVAGFVVLFFGTVVKAAMRARHLPPAVGLERMIGAEGVVTKRLGPNGIVQVASESWTARSVRGPLAKGARVRVVGVDRLKLDVEPIDQPASAIPGQAEGGTT